MLDTVTIEKMTSYYDSLFALLDAAKADVEDFEKALAVDDPERTLRVLRELTTAESYLLFADFSMFMGVERCKVELLGRGCVNYASSPGGVFLQFLEQLMGLPTRLLLASAYAEFGTAPEFKAGTHSIRFEIMDGAICYVMFEPQKGSSVKDVAAIAVGQALQKVLEKRGNTEKSGIGSGIDLMSWEPGSDKIH